MKKIYIVLIAALWALSMPMFARTAQEAAQVASQFISQSQIAPAIRMQRAAAATNMAKPVELAYTQYQINGTSPAVFVFNSQDAEGFVLVSADDNARAVLGYSDNGSFDQENIPENMQFWLQMYADELARAEANKPILKAGQITMAGQKRAATATYPTVLPILGKVEWGQDKPYNNLCPTVGGQRCVTGCVATAISQIMYVHKYPSKGTGSKTYTTETNKLKLSANFGSTTYDWNNMLATYTSSYNTTQATAVATLMYQVGVACSMDYDPDGSGAASSTSLASLGEYFGYDKGIQTWLKDYMKEEDILAAIAADLEIGHPVYISGATKNQEGHAFVCDGMQSNGYLHINWGWNGTANGYFTLSALDPQQQGTGGSASNLAFTEGVDIYTGIQPDKGGEAQPLVTVSNMTMTTAKEINRSAKVGFSLEDFSSTGMADAAGYVCYYIYDTSDNLVMVAPVGTFELPTGYLYTQPINISASIPSNLANGSYELEVAYEDNNEKHQPIWVKGKGVVRYPMTVTSSTITFGEGSGTGGGGGTSEAPAFTSIDVTNMDQSNVWSIDLYSSYFWEDIESDDEVLIRLTLNSDSKTSVIGSYVLDAANSGATGTINADALYSVGYYDACYQYTPTDLHLTITEGENGALQIQYYLEVNNIVESKTITIAAPNWYVYSGNKYYYYQDYVTYELAASLPASRAITMTQALSHTDLTEMSYFVSGTISTIRNTPEQIVQYTQARFDISDDGSTNNQFYCYNTKWLNNADFTTGKEIALGDKVVIYGPVQNYKGNTPEIKGYVFSYEKGATTTTYTIDNFAWQSYGKQLSFTFETEAPNIHIIATDTNGTEVASGVVDFTTVRISFSDYGTYKLWLRPMDADRNYAGEAVEYTITLVDYEIHNLQTNVIENRLEASWESNAPYFQVRITADNGDIIASQIIEYKSIYIDLEPGTYTLWIRPVDAAQQYYTADAAETTVVIEADYEIYDLNVTTEGKRMNATWTSNAPYFQVKIYQNGDTVMTGIIDYKSFSIELEDGDYLFWVRPVDENQQYYVGNEVEVEFQISTSTTDIDNLVAPQPTELYDLIGRLVDTKQSNDNREFVVPNSGVYIQRSGNNTNKIYINKR